MSQALATGNVIELQAAAYYLRQLQQFLQGASDPQYAAHVPALGGSIGGHTRHVIEHYHAILAARPHARLCFEERARDQRLQTERAHAMERLGTLLQAVEAWSLAYQGEGVSKGVLPCLQAPLLARTSLTGKLDEAVEIESTYAREWVYVVLHAVHHLALIAVAARAQGIPVDPRFGRAPATLYFEGHPIDYDGV